MTDLLASVVSPAQWALLVAVAGAILVPHLIPPVARWMGRGLRLLTNGRPVADPGRTPVPRPHRMAGPDPTPSRPSPWLIGLVVALSAAVLSWWLLRSR
jgi:hypothetical protein